MKTPKHKQLEYYFDCYHWDGYTATCSLKGGACYKKCSKHFISEDEYYAKLFEKIEDGKARISLADLKTTLKAIATHKFIDEQTPEQLFNVIKAKLIQKRIIDQNDESLD